ncbi:chorismate mutase family protein [Fulvimarina sp. 2208YS6-2-32]|uniref:chorismate mutase n=1 Tax=Fulvimarina uroteuthidis TaxID=3098149 RepID=A0ABU5I346_9HYPH|nr:chorismate mutase family protein [Fulvimarina sp. 2208YS6-2-32]MDY8109784.1 chorismate mutase family protein [Fulvimarina sp. 2208YS6-2-32]
MSEHRREPQDCETMGELRAEIDRVDAALFDLFAERMAYIHRAPAIKAPSNIPADVPERVRTVVENARRHAEARGLDPDLYGSFWERLVARAIETEEVMLGEPSTPDPRGK